MNIKQKTYSIEYFQMNNYLSVLKHGEFLINFSLTLTAFQNSVLTVINNVEEIIKVFVNNVRINFTVPLAQK